MPLCITAFYSASSPAVDLVDGLPAAVHTDAGEVAWQGLKFNFLIFDIKNEDLIKFLIATELMHSVEAFYGAKHSSSTSKFQES